LTIKELKEQRAKKVAQMENLVNERSDNIDENTLSAIKSFKDEIKEIDNSIEAINELRSVAIASAKPAEEKSKDAQAELRGLFSSYLRGELSTREFEKRSGTVIANGANVVPEDFLRELQETIKEYGTILPDCRQLTTSDNGTLTVPQINDTANEGVWLGETDAISKADFSTSKVELSAYKVATGIEVSTELIEDSFFNIESYVAKALGERLSRTIENAIINRDGTQKPDAI